MGRCTPSVSAPAGYTFPCIQPGCWCPTGFALQGTTCVQTTIPTFPCIQPGCTCPYGFTLDADTGMCVQQVIGGPSPPAPPTPPAPTPPAPPPPAPTPPAPTPTGYTFPCIQP